MDLGGESGMASQIREYRIVDTGKPERKPAVVRLCDYCRAHHLPESYTVTLRLTVVPAGARCGSVRHHERTDQ